jgi:hypothetical protein
MSNPRRTIACATVLTALIRAQAPNPVPAEEKTPLKLAVPVEPIAAIVDAFRSHRIVALGDNHGNEQGHTFRLSLIRDPRFAAAVDDIVVEFGSARYQDLMDRFVHGGDIPYESLRQVWQNTTQPEYEWDLPIYEEFFRAVRSINSSLPRERQVRVLLGDPPIDWDRVRTIADLRKQMGDRDAHAVEVIRSEVLARNRRALVIYGDEHLVRKNTFIDVADEWAGGIVARLEKAALTNVFSIHTDTRADWSTLQPDVAAWPNPSVAIIRGTRLGAADFALGPRRRLVRMEEQFDAFLYLGPPSGMKIAQLSHALCSDRGYMEMRLGRLALIPPPAGAPFNPVDRLKEYCALPEGGTEIPDREPAITVSIRQTIRDAALGKVDPARIAPESRERLIAFLKDNGPRLLGSLGAIESLTLLTDTSVGGKRIRRYRTVFANGQKLIWTVGLSSLGEIVSLDPRRE